MDIEILLWIQGLRNSFMDNFFQSITFLAEDKFFYYILALVYWCWRKELGLLMGFYLNLAGIVNTFVKSVVRKPRPFVIDERLDPVASAKAGATGFSFPSGHTSQAMSIYGGIAYSGKQKVLRILGGTAACLAAFSRLYLGVHTPQDVLVAIIIVIAMMYGVKVVSSYLEKNPKKDILIAIILILIAIGLAGISYAIPYDTGDAEMSYVMYKTYMDIVKKLMMLFAFLSCWIWDRRKLKYQIPDKIWKKAAVFFIGAISIYWFQQYGKGYIEDICIMYLQKENGKILARGVSSAILISWVYGIYPWMIENVRKCIAVLKRSTCD